MPARKRLAEEDAVSQPSAKSRHIESSMGQDDFKLDSLGGHLPSSKHPLFTLKLYSRTKAARHDPKPQSKDDDNQKAGNISSPSKEQQGSVEQQRAKASGETRLPTGVSDGETNLRIECVNDKYAEHDEFAGFHWLEPIDVFVTIENGVPNSALTSSKQVGFCMATLVRKETIATIFHKQMAKPFSELSLLAFDLFDRYGRLRHDYKEHPVRKGSGFWKDELDTRDILLIEDIHVDEPYRRQGIGSRMISILLDVVSHKTKQGEFVALLWPESRKNTRLHQTMEHLVSSASLTSTVEYPDLATIRWFRSLGFRRIGSSIWLGLTPCREKSPRIRALLMAAMEKASDLAHEILIAKKGHYENAAAELLPINERRHDESKKKEARLPQPEDQSSAVSSIRIQTTRLTGIAPEGDYDPPPPTSSTLPERIKHAATGSPDKLFRAIKAHFFFIVATDEEWFGTDRAGNTILHLAAFKECLNAIKWILQRPCAVGLLQKRNVNGDTPLETLLSKLENQRTRLYPGSSILSWSDRFSGHSHVAAQCIAQLSGLQNPQHEVLQRLAGGCTCGQCVEGCMSPRSQFDLTMAAAVLRDCLSEGFATMSGTHWVEEHLWLLAGSSRYYLKMLEHNKSVRRGLISLCEHVKNCIAADMLPDETSIMDMLDVDEQQKANTKNFLKGGGSVEAVVMMIFQWAVQTDDVTGEGSLAEDWAEELEDLPTCRNDHEFGYLSGRCGYWQIEPV